MLTQLGGIKAAFLFARQSAGERRAARANCRLPPRRRRRAAVDEGDDGDEADIIAVVADYEGGAAAVGTIAIVVVFSRTCCQSR